jgi:hypothetical protein
VKHEPPTEWTESIKPGCSVLVRSRIHQTLVKKKQRYVKSDNQYQDRAAAYMHPQCSLCLVQTYLIGPAYWRGPTARIRKERRDATYLGRHFSFLTSVYEMNMMRCPADPAKSVKTTSGQHITFPTLQPWRDPGRFPKPRPTLILTPHQQLTYNPAKAQIGLPDLWLSSQNGLRVLLEEGGLLSSRQEWPDSGT